MIEVRSGVGRLGKALHAKVIQWQGPQAKSVYLNNK